jgi:hypothetical protein
VQEGEELGQLGRIAECSSRVEEATAEEAREVFEMCSGLPHGSREGLSSGRGCNPSTGPPQPWKGSVQHAESFFPNNATAPAERD